MPDKLSYEQAAELYTRVLSEAEARNSRARRFRIAGAVVVLIAGLAGFSAYLATSSGGSRASDSTKQPDILGAWRGLPWKPPVNGLQLPGEKAVSLAQAKTQAVFPVLAPSADAVSAAVPDLTAGAPAAEPATGGTPADSAMRAIWFEHEAFADGSSKDVVVIAYSHLEILEEQMEVAYYDGPKVYRGMVDEQADPNAYIGTIQGSTAYIAPPNDDQGMVHPGYVTFMKGDVQIMVEGYYPAEDLVAIARSLS